MNGRVRQTAITLPDWLPFKIGKISDRIDLVGRRVARDCRKEVRFADQLNWRNFAGLFAGGICVSGLGHVKFPVGLVANLGINRSCRWGNPKV